MSAVQYARPVKDNQEIRAWNFQLLLMECERELGKPRGSPALLAERTGVKASLISGLVNKRIHSSSGKLRQIGDHTARQLEHGMQKPKGWMDVDHTLANTPEEAAYLDRLRLLTPSQRSKLMAWMEEFGELNAAAGSRLVQSDSDPDTPRPPGH